MPFTNLYRTDLSLQYLAEIDQLIQVSCSDYGCSIWLICRLSWLANMQKNMCTQKYNSTEKIRITHYSHFPRLWRSAGKGWAACPA